jgi:hypothetical protein
MTVVSVIGALMITIVSLANAQGKSLNFRELTSISLRALPWMLVYGIIAALAVAIGLILFIAPGVIALTWLVLGTFIVVDKKVDAFQAMSQSRQLARGNAGKIWAVLGAGILVGFGVNFAVQLPLFIAAAINQTLGTVLATVASVVSTYISVVVTTLLAMLYLYLRDKPATQPAATPTVAPVQT